MKTLGRVVVLGSGWGGFRFLQALQRKSCEVTVVSPRNYFVFTPLLASTAVGTLEHRCIVEPIRYHAKDVEVIEANCSRIDFQSKTIQCESVFRSLSSSTTGIQNKNDRDQFQIPYDHLLIACGANSNTFGIPGVQEHAFFLKDIGDARKIRGRVIECFERASQPTMSEEMKRNLLHFAVVGGGPTGIEFSAELNDFIVEDMARLYPELTKRVSMTVYDVANKILSSFDEELSHYTMKRFLRKGIRMELGKKVREVKPYCLVLDDGKQIPFGMLVWSTGLVANPLVSSVDIAMKDKAQRLVTDAYMRVLDQQGCPIERVYALGDCATIKDYPLPQTAQVAKQKGIYLAKSFNQLAKTQNWMVPIDQVVKKPFSFSDMGSMAYIGGWRAVVDLKSAKSRAKGPAAWFLWRSAYFTMSVSWKNKVLIPMFWFLTWAFGRDISRIN